MHSSERTQQKGQGGMAFRSQGKAERRSPFKRISAAGVAALSLLLATLPVHAGSQIERSAGESYALNTGAFSQPRTIASPQEFADLLASAVDLRGTTAEALDGRQALLAGGGDSGTGPTAVSKLELFRLAQAGSIFLRGGQARVEWDPAANALRLTALGPSVSGIKSEAVEGSPAQQRSISIRIDAPFSPSELQSLQALERRFGSPQSPEALATALRETFDDAARTDQTAFVDARDAASGLSRFSLHSADRGSPASATANAEPASPSAHRPQKKPKAGGKLLFWLSADALTHVGLAWWLLSLFQLPPLPGNPHGWLVHTSNALYVFSNALAFVFVRPQIYSILKHQANGVSLATQLVGTVSSALLFVAALATGSVFLAMQNLYGTLAFAAVTILYFKPNLFSAGHAPSSSPKTSTVRFPSWNWRSLRFAWKSFRFNRSALIQTSVTATLFAIAVAAVQYAIGLLFGGSLSSLSESLSKIPGMVTGFQLLSTVGFAYFVLPQWLKIRHDGSPKQFEPRMILIFMVAALSIGLWSFHYMLSPFGAVSDSVLAALAEHLAGYYGIVALASFPCLMGIAWLADRLDPIANWIFNASRKAGITWLTDRVKQLSDDNRLALLGFVPLVLFILAMIALGWLGLPYFIQLPSDPTQLTNFHVYMIYTLSNVIQVIASGFTLAAYIKYRKKD